MIIPKKLFLFNYSIIFYYFQKRSSPNANGVGINKFIIYINEFIRSKSI